MLVAAVLAVFCIASVIFAYSIPATNRVDVGTTYAAPYLRGFFAPEQNATFNYAYTGRVSEFRFDGAGSGPHTLLMRISGWRPEGVEPARLRIFAGEQLIHDHRFASPEDRGIRTYRIPVQSPGGDLRLRFETNTFWPEGDQRALGVPIDWIEVQSPGGMPAPGQLGFVLALALLGLLLLLQLGASPLRALLVCVPVVLVLAAMLALHRIWWTDAIPRLAGILLGVNLAILVLHRLLPWVWTVGQVAFTPRHTRILLGIVAVAALWKLGGVLYPHIIVYDQRYHVPRTELVLNGQILKLLLPSDVTALSVTVGFEGGHLPYSPLWYLLVAPFGLAGVDLGIASNALNAAIDVSRSILIAYLAMRLFERAPVALWAAGMYHLLEMPYYLLSWGNWPTQLGLWGGLFFLCVIAGTIQRAGERRALVVLGAGAVVSMLTYTVLGVITFATVALLAMLELLRRNVAGNLRARALVLALLIGEGVAFLLYHIWYVPVILADTVPALTKRLTEPTAQLHGAPRPGFWAMQQINWNYTLNHIGGPLSDSIEDAWSILLIPSWLHLFCSVVVMALLIAGGVLAFRQAVRGHRLMAAWLLALVGFSVFDWAVAEMIFKHIFFTLPLFAIFFGVAFDTLWRARFRLARLIPLGTCLYLLAFVADRWWFYIMVKRH